MAGYSAKPLWPKLGLGPDAEVLLIDAPAGWSIPGAPEQLGLTREASGACASAPAQDVIAFFQTLAGLRESLPPIAERIFPDGALWTAWPRRAGGHDSDIREQDIRELALALGLVDVKVAALDDDWSAAPRVARRAPSSLAGRPRLGFQGRSVPESEEEHVAIDLQRVSDVSTEPGELPATMAAWVIREERQGEPKDAFQVEEIEVPEPGAFEVIVRVMAAGVNYNNVWAALGKPVSVMRYGDHPEFGHHIGGSDASGVVWKVGEGVTRWKPGDEVVIHCNQASYEDPEVHGLDPLAAPSQKIWGYETTWGSFAQFTKVQAQQLLHKPPALTWEEAASYGLVYFTAYRMLLTRCKLQAGHKVLIWGAAGGLGVFATQLCATAGAHCVGVVSSAQKGELVKRLGAVDFIDRNEFAGMMRTGKETAEEEKARFGASREFAKRVKQILTDAPDIVFEHVGQATFPTSVFTVKPFGKVVICAGTTGYKLDFDVRYLWMKQKEILGSHFANAYECTKANELIESGQIRPVLWRTLGFDGVAEAHQLMLENKHLGKISILVGAEHEGEGKTAEGPGAIHAEVGA